VSGDEGEKTRVTAIIQKPAGEGEGRKGGDCLVVIYTKEPTLLGKRFVLDTSPMRIGRGAENHIVLDGDSVSREARPPRAATGACGGASTTGRPTGAT
jgi:two-component system cell cycle response regulator